MTTRLRSNKARVGEALQSFDDGPIDPGTKWRPSGLVITGWLAGLIFFVGLIYNRTKEPTPMSNDDLGAFNVTEQRSAQIDPDGPPLRVLSKAKTFDENPISGARMSSVLKPHVKINSTIEKPRDVSVAKCPASTVLNGSCIHANNKLACVPLRDDHRDDVFSANNANPGKCVRPCGALAIKLRGAGGVTLREGLLMSIYGGAAFGKGLDESFVVSEGFALGTPRLDEKVKKYSARDAVFITALRHPIFRILSRYWLVSLTKVKSDDG